MKKLLLFLLLIPSVVLGQTSHGRLVTDSISNRQTITITGATPDVSTGNIFKTNNGGATTITNFLNGHDAQNITIICGEANTVIANNSNIVVATASNYQCVLNASIQFVFSSAASQWIQSASASTGQAVASPVGVPSPFVFNVDVQLNNSVPKGPNPYVDVTRYNVRALASNATPAIAGITANINNAQTSATVSTSACGGQIGNVCFVNGDGVVIYGAGASQSMSTPTAPTVTPSIARVLTGTGDVVNGLTGATTYNYKIIACDIGGGCTAASPAGTTTTGAATLGAASAVTVSTYTRVNNTVSVVTSSAHGLTVGSMVYLTGATDTSFTGWYAVATTADNTHFTFISGNDTRNGGTASSTGGTVLWFNTNHVTWSSVTSAFRYFIYSDRAVPGTFKLVGVSKPVDGTFTDGTLYWDDFGSPMMDNLVSVPGYIPTNAPSSATNDNLVTTISSGAGTTSLVLAASASNTVSGATILFDNSPNAKTATSSAAGAPTYFPVATNGGTYVFNSVLDISGLSASWIGAGQRFNDTLVWGAVQWRGNPLSVIGSSASFQFESYPGVDCNAIPCVLIKNGQSGRMDGLQFTGHGNNDLLVLHDGGGGSAGTNYERINFVTGADSTDYMGMGFMGRGAVGLASATAKFKEVLFLVGPAFVTGTTATPAFYVDDAGQIVIESVFFNRRSLLVRADTSGSVLSNSWGYVQGDIVPYATFTGPFAGNGSISATLDNVTLDTTPTPLAAYFPSSSGASVSIRSFISGGPSSGVPMFSGNPLSFISGLATGQNTSAIQNANFTNNPVQVGGIGVLGYQMPTPNTPTVVLGGGGSCASNCVPSGTYVYAIVANDINGLHSNMSLCSSSVTTDGTKTITVSWVPIDGQVTTQWFRSASTCGNALSTFAAGTGVTGASFADSGSNFPSVSQAAANGGSSSAMSSNGVSAPKITYTNGTFTDTINGTLTANRTQTLRDVTGNFMLDSTADSITGVKSFASGTLLPSTGGGTDLGSTALPFGNLWLGTAATNNFKFAPNSTTAARTVTLADPGANVTLPFLSATDTTTTHAAFATATAGVVSTRAIATGDLPTSGIPNVVYNNTTNTGTSAMTLDMSAVTVANAFKVPLIAGATSGADGVVVYDSTNKNTHVRTNGADSIVGAFSAAPTTGDVVSATIASGNTLLSDTGFLATNVVRKDAANVGAAAMTLDMSAATGATAFRVPVIAGATSGSNGTIDYDSTNNNTHIRTNAADSLAVAEAAALAANVIPKATNATNSLVTSSSMTDNGTTVSTSDTSGYTAATFISSSANPAASGVLRAASGDSLGCFRNNANAADKCIVKSGAVSGGISADTLDLTQFGMNKITGRTMVVGTAPTCTFTSGGGTGPSCTVDTGSTDLSGIIIATTGTGAPAALGTITLTFSASYGTNKPACVYTLSDNGAGQWNARATAIDKTPATGSDLFNWDNNAIALGTSTAFWVNYSCGAK